MEQNRLLESDVRQEEASRLVHDGATCPRCGDTGAEVRKAAETLATVVAPLGISVVLEEVEMDLQEFTYRGGTR